MAEITNTLIRHLRADTTIAPLCGGTRIDHEIGASASGSPSATYPAIAVVPGVAEQIHQAALSQPQDFLIQTVNRADLITIQQRLRTLFQEKWHYTLASGTADALLCIGSYAEPNGEPPAQPAGPDGPWEVRETYRFLTAVS